MVGLGGAPAAAAAAACGRSGLSRRARGRTGARAVPGAECVSLSGGRSLTKAARAGRGGQRVAQRRRHRAAQQRVHCPGPTRDVWRARAVPRIQRVGVSLLLRMESQRGVPDPSDARNSPNAPLARTCVLAPLTFACTAARSFAQAALPSHSLGSALCSHDARRLFIVCCDARRRRRRRPRAPADRRVCEPPPRLLPAWAGGVLPGIGERVGLRQRLGERVAERLPILVGLRVRLPPSPRHALDVG